MCIHGDSIERPVTAKASAKARVVTQKTYVKDLTQQLREATRELAKAQKAYVNA